GDWAGLTAKTRQVLGWIHQARGQGNFVGVEHVGLYPARGASGQAMAQWYAKRFGFVAKEGNSSFFVSGLGPGRIEIMKAGDTDRCHVAIRVADFEAAVAALEAQGLELTDAKIRPEAKAIYLKETDPAGNLVHLLWSA
ncbi:MAG: VOC family protein, partial [Chloroflexi bacterium]|nr:VOC family protein [Chloroflexota bacterium]